MPSLSSKETIEHLLQNVESSSARLGDSSTFMSEIIEIVDARLKSMPGKTQVGVSDGDLSLWFGRIGQNWGLWITDAMSDIDPDSMTSRIPISLPRASIPRKTRAFALLPQLLRDIDGEHKRLIAGIDDTFDRLREGT